MESFVIKTVNGKYIAVDAASGGYPYETERISDAKIWSSKQEAFAYNNLFKKQNWTLHRLVIETTLVSWV